MDETTTTVKDINPMRKIILMIGVAIFVFLAFTTYSVNKSLQSSSQLKDIRDLYFPVLERVDANIVRLDKMQENYLTAVMTGDEDMVAQATDLHSKTDAVFAELLQLNPARQDEILKLRGSAKKYNDLATEVSAVLLAKNGQDVTERTALMSSTLQGLRQGIKSFRDSSYTNFVQTLGDTQSSVKLNLYMGLALGLMNLCFMGVLVFFVRNNVKMIAVIAEQNATLENRVAERTAQLTQKTNDINAMLHNMKLGVCTVVPGNKIHPEFSEYMRSIFGVTEFADKDVMQTVFAKSRLGSDAQDQVAAALSAIIGEESMMFDFNSHLLAREMQIEVAGGPLKTLQMDWSPILNTDDVVDKMLLIVQDVTHLRELELASAHQKEELETISQIIKISIGKFNDFIGSAHKYLAENRRLIQETAGRDPEIIAALFRNMHTIKGNARTYELKLVTDVAHEAEQAYDQLRKVADAPWDAPAMVAGLDAVELAVARYVDVNENKLGRKGRASDLLTTRGSFVSNDDITQLRTMVSGLLPQNGSSEFMQLHKVIHHLGLISLERLVSGAVDSLSSLAKELDKPTPAVDIVHGDIAFNSQFAEALKSSFMHIVRNSMDHGIEAPPEREAAGKPAQGRLRFACEDNNGAMELHINDDGRGLALHKLYEKGVANGVFSADSPPSAQAVADLIFHSGLSTAQTVSMVSGRGVGMDAVRAFLKEHGASVRIVLDSTPGTLSFTPFRFVISLPISTFSL